MAGADANKNRELLARVDELEARLGENVTWAEWLEAVAYGLQEMLDDLTDVDDMTVGEVKRLRVLAEAVRDGAKTVVTRTSLARQVVDPPSHPIVYPGFNVQTTSYGNVSGSVA